MESRYQVGCFAVSKAGHDWNKIYVIINQDTEYVYLADGKLKRLQMPKKKKFKHIQIVNTIDQDIETKLSQNQLLKNEDIKIAIKRYKTNCNGN